MSGDLLGKTTKTVEKMSSDLRGKIVETKTPKMKACDFCDKKFKTNASMKDHVKAKHSFLKCTMCDMVFLERIDVTQHYYDSHLNKCHECKKTFKNKHVMIDHMISAHFEKLCIREYPQK